jgi:hypothetical protein
MATAMFQGTAPQNPQLATWIKCQRRQHKLLCDGKPSNMSLEQITDLANPGFEWTLRSQTSTTWFSKHASSSQEQLHSLLLHTLSIVFINRL